MRALLSLAVVLLVGLGNGGAGVERNEALLDWIRDLGGGVHGVRLQSIPGMGTGVVATRNLEVGTVVTRTPLTALISLEHALVSELFGSLSEELPQLSNTNLKALFLAHERKKGTREKGEGSEGEKREERGREGEEEIMTEHVEKGEAEKAGCENEAQLEEEEKGTLEEVVEKEEEEAEEEEDETEVVDGKEEGETEEKEEGGKSFWQPYLDSLPPVLHTTLFFTEDDLHHLQTSMVRDFAEKQQSAAKKAYELVTAEESKFSELQNLSLEDLKWGVSIWSSRAHSVRVRDTLGEWQIASCLVPFADMFNMAARETDISVRCDTNEDSTHFECRTTKPVRSGTQLLAEYVTHPDKRHNGRLLLHYGFVLPGNPYGSVSIKLPEITHDLAHFKERQDLSKKLQVLKKPFLQLTHPSAPNPSVDELLKVMRLVHGSVPELQRSAKLSPPFSLPLSPSSEERVLKKTHDYLRDILSSYHTTAEHDIHTLHSGEGLTHNSWLAVVLRSEEKRLLTANMAHLLSSLQQQETQRKKHHQLHRKTEL